MAKLRKKTKKQLFFIGSLLVLIFLFIFFRNSFTIISPSDREFKWNNYLIKAHSSTNFAGISASGGCSYWHALIEPTDDTTSAVRLNAKSSFGQCSGNGADARIELIIPNPRKYKQIYLQISGYARTGYGGTSNCPSASANVGVTQQGGNSVTILSGDANCAGTDKSFPTTILLNIENDFVIIPTTQTALKLINDTDLIFYFSVSANGNTNGRGGEASLSLNSIETTLKDIVCGNNEIKYQDNSCHLMIRQCLDNDQDASCDTTVYCIDDDKNNICDVGAKLCADRDNNQICDEVTSILCKDDNKNNICDTDEIIFWLTHCEDKNSNGLCDNKESEFCLQVYTPVCTIDDITYANECSALKAGKIIKTQSECQLKSIIIKPTCNSCPTDTQCLTSGEDVICVQEKIIETVKEIEKIVEIPKIIEKEILIEKIVEKPIIKEKEIVVEKIVEVTKIPIFVWFIILIIIIFIIGLLWKNIKDEK